MRPNFVTKKLQKIVPQIGGKLLLEPNYRYSGCIIFDNGTRSFYKESSFDINPQGAVKIAIDKGYSSYFLQEFGFKIPEWDTFVHEALNKHLPQKKGIAAACDYANKLGFPVIIKPNEGTKGKHVYKVHNEEELRNCAKLLFADTKVMLVQQFVRGNDFRILVFNSKVYCAYQRVPLHIMGNGVDSILELLKKKEGILNGIHTLNVEDKRIQNKLQNEGLSYGFVPKKGQRIPLLSLANLSLGGHAVDCTNTISTAYQNLAIEISQKMNLKLCGIDIMSDSIDGEIGDYWIIEINSAPGQSNYAQLGTTQTQIVEDLYKDILLFIKNRGA